MQRVSVTLRQILDLDVLRRAGVRVVAGAEALDRPVRWVHIAEIADIAKLINGGELLLTTGMGIERAASAQRRYLAEIAEAGAAGLVVELGRAFGEIPPAMVQAAAQRGFPLIALERETRYIEVTEAVHRAIISDQYELLRQAEAISRDFTDLILSGADIRQIIERLAEILGNPVVLADAAQHVVELAGRGAVLALWEEHARLAHTEVERGRVHQAGGGGPGVPGSSGREDEPKCMWVGIWLRHEEWGRVHVLETDRKLDEITGLVLDRAGAALGLALLSQKDAAHLAGRAGSALLADVLAGRHGSVAEFLRRARSLGVDLTQGRLVALVVEATSLAELARRHALAEEERQRIRLSIADEIRRAARERQCAALVGLDADRVLAIIAVTGHDPVPPILDDIVEAAARRIRAGDASLTVAAGAGREVAASSLQRALEEAVEALSFGRKAGEARAWAEGGRPPHRAPLRRAGHLPAAGPAGPGPGAGPVRRGRAEPAARARRAEPGQAHAHAAQLPRARGAQGADGAGAAGPAADPVRPAGQDRADPRPGPGHPGHQDAPHAGDPGPGPAAGQGLRRPRVPQVGLGLSLRRTGTRGRCSVSRAGPESLFAGLGLRGRCSVSRAGREDR